MTITDNILSTLTSMGFWELIAVLLGVAYLVLAMRQSNWCWPAAFLGTVISIVIFWNVSLLMESALNVYYLAMAMYGWWSWRSGVQAQPLPIQTWRWSQHLAALLLVLSLTLASGYWLTHHSQAALPYLDSFTTWGAIITTWMVTRKVLENWLYWLVVDGAAAYMYASKELYFFTALMLVYLVMVVFGWLKWQREYQEQEHDKKLSNSFS